MTTPTAVAELINLRAGRVVYTVDPTTLKVDAPSRTAGPGRGRPAAAAPIWRRVKVAPVGKGWRWTDSGGGVVDPSRRSKRASPAPDHLGSERRRPQFLAPCLPRRTGPG
ncbi:hypothetical protein ACRAWD_18035 [Caulobacter segnis]